MNPNGKVPVLTDGDFIMFEGFAIARYLITTFLPESNLYPSDAKARALFNMEAGILNEMRSTQ